MYRLINYTFGFIIVYLFVLEAGMKDHIMIFTGLALSAVVAYVAFLGNWITLDATKSTILLGTIVFGFGGWMLAFALIFFFVSSSLLTRRKHLIHKNPNDSDSANNRRDGYQVWANGFWLALFCVIGFITGYYAFLVACFAVIAAATADTWATEIGLIKPGKTIDILTFNETEAGVDGGISLKGSVAAAAGAFLISLFLLMGPFLVPTGATTVVFACGLAGCFIDSGLGSLFAEKSYKTPLPADFSGNLSEFNNSLINWLSTGISGILALLIIQIFY